jgi:hypothetical protein
VLVVVLCRNRIAVLSFRAGQRKVSLVALFHALKALRLRSGRTRYPTIQPGGTWSELALRGRSVIISHFRSKSSLLVSMGKSLISSPKRDFWPQKQL